MTVALRRQSGEPTWPTLLPASRQAAVNESRSVRPAASAPIMPALKVSPAPIVSTTPARGKGRGVVQRAVTLDCPGPLAPRPRQELSGMRAAHLPEEKLGAREAALLDVAAREEHDPGHRQATSIPGRTFSTSIESADRGGRDGRAHQRTVSGRGAP